MWLLKETTKGDIITEKEMSNAITKECGYHHQTLKSVKEALIRLGWVIRAPDGYKTTEIDVDGY